MTTKQEIFDIIRDIKTIPSQQFLEDCSSFLQIPESDFAEFQKWKSLDISGAILNFRRKLYTLREIVSFILVAYENSHHLSDEIRGICDEFLNKRAAEYLSTADVEEIIFQTINIVLDTTLATREEIIVFISTLIRRINPSSQA